jgi:hypothetical protein
MMDNLPARQSAAAPGWYPYGDTGARRQWDGTAWVGPLFYPQPVAEPVKRGASQAVIVWRVWCLAWALFWLFFFWPFALVSIGAALIPWGGNR